MDLKTSIIPYMGIRFLTNQAEIFYGNSGDFYLSIGGEKSCFDAFLEKNHFFGAKGSGTSRPDQKFGPMG